MTISRAGRGGKNFRALVWNPLETDPEERIQKQVIYLQRHLQIHGWWSGEGRQTIKSVLSRCWLKWKHTTGELLGSVLFGDLLSSEAWERAALVAQTVKNLPAGDPGSIPEWVRSPAKGNGYPLQYSCQENSMNKRAWQAIAHGAAKSQTWLSD